MGLTMCVETCITLSLKEVLKNLHSEGESRA